MHPLFFHQLATSQAIENRRRARRRNGWRQPRGQR
jgi:hypothetical protein